MNAVGAWGEVDDRRRSAARLRHLVAPSFAVAYRLTPEYTRQVGQPGLFHLVGRRLQQVGDARCASTEPQFELAIAAVTTTGAVGDRGRQTDVRSLKMQRRNDHITFNG